MNFTEKELEDYIWQDQSCLNDVLYYPVASPLCDAISKLGRQVRCETGIIDLVLQAHTVVYVVELKATRAGTKEIGQLSRYADYVSRALFNICPRNSNGEYAKYLYMRDCIECHKVLIAPDFDDIVIGCANDKCHLVTVDKTNGGFSFSAVYPRFFSPSKELEGALSPFYDYMVGLADVRFDCERKQEIMDASALFREVCISPN